MGAHAVAPDVPMLEVRGLSKRFGPRQAVADISFTIHRGDLYGLLGHNGAGKSTTIGAVLGQIYPDRGTIRLAGQDVFQDRRIALARVGAIFETPCFYSYLSGWKNLEVFTHCTRLTSKEEIQRAVRRVGLSDRIHDRVGKYSHGMRQRLALAQALLPDPDFLILDEPTDGLDPEGIAEIRDLIVDLNRREALTILLCSHQLEEVQRLCRRLAVLREGRLVFEGDWQSAGQAEAHVRLETDGTSSPYELLEQDGLLQRHAQNWVMAPGHGLADAVDQLVRVHRRRVHHAALQQPSLEDFYLRLTRQRGGES